MLIYIEKNWKYDSTVKYIMKLFIANNFDLNYHKNCWFQIWLYYSYNNRALIYTTFCNHFHEYHFSLKFIIFWVSIGLFLTFILGFLQCLGTGVSTNFIVFLFFCDDLFSPILQWNYILITHNWLCR